MTQSFKFEDQCDRDYWKLLRGETVDLEIEDALSPLQGLRRPRQTSCSRAPASTLPSAAERQPFQLTRAATTLFDAYLFCDWSANSSPKTGKDSIWIGEGWFGDQNRFVLQEPANPETRSNAEDRLKERIAHHVSMGRRVLIGFDFPLGYPQLALPRLVDRQPKWRQLWQLLESSVQDDSDNQNNRFELASQLNERMAGEHAYWGCPEKKKTNLLTATKTVRGRQEYRVVEARLRSSGKRPFSVWQLFGKGSVGSQSLLGIPVCERLRADDSLQIRVWPFETGMTAPSQRHQNVMVEFWPGTIAIDESVHEVRDAAQVTSLVTWAARADCYDELLPYFELPGLGEPERTIVERIEGWILGFNC